jgi:twitching motility protein PilJ
LKQAAREKAESDALQTDVGHLLDMVSAVEEGDLTVQAPVSDRVTGLVADKFNRLVEELAQVMSQVLGAARQMSTGVSTLEQIANAVATNANQQAQSVNQTLQLSEQVEQSVQDSAQQIQATNRSLSALSQTVAAGQAAIATLTQGTEVLHQGSDRIIQQMKTLGEFVGLAEQFVQDQNQIATQTQVLAMNASLVAARAAEQQNPRQFIVAAREFEAIADQVSRLAQQTNESLAVLEQRTTQIQTVVSAIDADVQNLGGLVGGFTRGVEQSNQVFKDVQMVAAEAVSSSEVVAYSNELVVKSFQSTAAALQDIANLAQQTVQLTQTTQSQSEAMGSLSAQLLQRVEFFRLPAALMSQAANTGDNTVDLSQADESTIEITSTTVPSS